MKRVNFLLVILVLAILPLSLSAAKKSDKNLDLKSESSTSKTEQKQSVQEKERSTSSTQAITVQDTKPVTTTIDEKPVKITPITTNSPVVKSPEAGETINWQVLSGGATDATSASYHLLGTLGQVAVGTIVSTSYSIHQGYWQDFGSGGGCCGQYTGGQTGNVTCDIEGKRNLADITRLIDHVYISKTDLCCNENGNTNGDIEQKRNLADITILIDHVYISKNETAACL